MDLVRRMVPLDTSTWLSIPDNTGVAAADTTGTVDCDQLASWLDVDVPDVTGYTRTCDFYSPSLGVLEGQAVTALPSRHLVTNPQDRFDAQVSYAPAAVDHTPSAQSDHQGPLTVWIRDVTAESATWGRSWPGDSDPLDAVNGGHVTGVLHGRPATVRRTLGDRTSVTTLVRAGGAVLAVELSSGSTPEQALTAAGELLPRTHDTPAPGGP